MIRPGFDHDGAAANLIYARGMLLASLRISFRKIGLTKDARGLLCQVPKPSVQNQESIDAPSAGLWVTRLMEMI